MRDLTAYCVVVLLARLGRWIERASLRLDRHWSVGWWTVERGE
ncbi:MAG: hypothetical protein M5U15_13655 [Kiritimatiellae bacterium]|nr:hypothetical protein [Kiritimatiellia bacterium]